MMRFAASALHELRDVVHDRAALLVLLVAPIGYALIYPLPYARQLAREVPVIVVDEDGGAAARQLARMIDATEQVAVAGSVQRMADAETLVRAGSVHGVIVIPAGFERALRRGESATVGILGDATRFMYYSQVATGASHAAGTMSAGIEVRRHQAGGASESLALHARDPLPLDVHALFNPSGAYGTAIIPAVLILILQQTMLVGIGTLAGGRREDGTGDSDAGGVLARAVHVAGRGSAHALVSSVHLALYCLVVFAIYDVPFQGSLATMLPFLLPFFLATAFLAITVSSLFRDRETALPVLITTSLPALFVSGFPWPTEALPSWLRAAALALPSTSAIDGAVRMSRLGASLADLRADWLMLWLLCALYLTAALCAAGTDPQGARAPAPPGVAGRGPGRHPAGAEISRLRDCTTVPESFNGMPAPGRTSCLGRRTVFLTS